MKLQGDIQTPLRPHMIGEQLPYLEFNDEFGTVSRLTTPFYFGAPEVGEAVTFHIEKVRGGGERRFALLTTAAIH